MHAKHLLLLGGGPSNNSEAKDNVKNAQGNRMFFWLWKSHVIKQGPNRRPNLKSTKLLTRGASFPPESEKTQWFSLLSQARLAKKVPLHIVRKCSAQMFCSRAGGLVSPCRAARCLHPSVLSGLSLDAQGVGKDFR